jgi:anti-sigma factor RsiW
MNPQLSERDLEQISAYLDGGLDSRATAQMEERIKREPELARAFKQFGVTRTMLRHSPQRRVPRPFTLTWQMIGQVAPRPSWNSYSLVSAAASLFLVIAILGDFAINGLPIQFGAAAPAADAAAETFMMQEAPVEGGVAEESQPVGEPQAEDLASADRMAKGSEFDARAFFAQNARPIEFGLAVVALLAGILALVNKREV